MLNLPNMAGLPYSASLTVAQKRILQSIAVGFSAQTNTLVQQGALVIDLMCDARSYQTGELFQRRLPPERRGLLLHARPDLPGGDDRKRAATERELSADDDVLRVVAASTAYACATG